MASHEASQTVEIAAPAEVAFEALTDYDRLAEWQSAIDELEVTEHHPNGMGEVVSYVVDVKVRKVRYALRYSYEAPKLIRFELVEGDVDDIQGSYRFEPTESGGCSVTATIAVDPGVSVPGPIKRMLAGQMLKRTLSELRKRSEAIAESAA
jgi:ribosome-associated toxin RatA of RatAB toxin-antitoxin module